MYALPLLVCCCMLSLSAADFAAEFRHPNYDFIANFKGVLGKRSWKRGRTVAYRTNQHARAQNENQSCTGKSQASARLLLDHSNVKMSSHHLFFCFLL